MNMLSLFANIGVAEAYLKKIGVNVVIANELIERRAILYSKIYPETHMICGDITNEKIFKKIVDESIDRGVNIIMATPPCQGMSTAGLKKKDDPRNCLIIDVVKAIKLLNPKFVIIENVPEILQTKIEIDGEWIYLDTYILQQDMRIRMPKSILTNLNIEKGKAHFSIYFDKKNNCLVLKIADSGGR